MSCRKGSSFNVLKAAWKFVAQQSLTAQQGAGTRPRMRVQRPSDSHRLRMEIEEMQEYIINTVDARGRAE